MITSTDLWPKRCFLFLKCLQCRVVSESSFSAYVCHRRHVGLHRHQRILLGHNVCVWGLRQDPPDLIFWSFLTFLHHGIEEVERNLPWKFHKKIQRKSWSNVPPKLLACIIRLLYKVVHTNGRLRKFNRAREIEFNFFIAFETWHTYSSYSWLQNSA